jgi:hypothetical protein
LDLVKQVVHISGSEAGIDLMEYMDFLIKKVIPKILQLPGVIKADVTRLTHMTITPNTQIDNNSKVSLQAQVYYESEEAYEYITSNVLDEDLIQILKEGAGYISLYSGYQYSFQKY